jgi:[acyl-carrier-protein] S-malonyltransferase
MTWAALFPGQGSLDPAALGWLHADAAAEAPLYNAIAQATGTAEWRQRMTDEDWRCSNRVAQVLACGLGLAAWRHLQAVPCPAPSVVAGYSVGMLAAIAAAGAVAPLQAVDLAVQRAGCMDAAAGGQPQAMLSLRGPTAALQRACAAHALAIAIRLGAEHLIVAGSAGHLAELSTRLTEDGLETRALDVRIASHTPAMAAASPDFASILDACPLATSAMPVVCDLDGAATRDPTRLRNALAAHLTQTVRWDLCMQTIAERRVRKVLEIGSKPALASIWNQTHRDIPARATAEFARWQDAVAWLES